MTAKNKEPMSITKTPQRVFDTIVIDMIGPLQTSNYGNKYSKIFDIHTYSKQRCYYGSKSHIYSFHIDIWSNYNSD